MRKKSILLGLVLIIIIATLIPVTACTKATPSEVITVRCLRPFAYDSVLSGSYRSIIELGNEMGKGRVEFKDIGGSEVYPIFEQLKAVEAGAVDLLWTAASYTMSDFPEGDVFFLTYGADAKDFRNGGLLDALSDICREKNGVDIIGTGTYLYFHLFVNKQINSIDDLKGMKLRSLPSFDPVVQKLGVSTTSIAPGEIYTAMQTKVVDGLIFPSYGLIEMGIAEGIEYQVYPPFWVANNTMIFVNSAWFDALPDDAKNIVTKLAEKVDDNAYDLYNDVQGEETKAMREMGVKSIVLSDDDWWKVQEMEQELGSARLKELAPDSADRLIEICAKWYPPKKVLYPPFDWK
jgi:TRAP-type C4-dicarboxylate transport system substrate-binding protein